jgi:hypothetical protein
MTGSDVGTDDAFFFLLLSSFGFDIYSPRGWGVVMALARGGAYVTDSDLGESLHGCNRANLTNE